MAKIVEQPTGIGKQAWPWLAMGCVTMAGMAARVAVLASGEDQEVAQGISLAAFTTAVVIGFATRRRLTSQLRRRWWAALALAAGWVGVIGAIGLSWTALSLLTIVGCALSLLWWREHRVENPGKPRPAQPSADHTPAANDPDIYIRRWAKNMAAPGRPLPKSRLHTPIPIKAGWQFTLELVPGVHTVEQTRAAVGTVGALRLLPGQQVMVEEHPDLPAPAAVLTVVTNPPIRTPQKWPGPDRGVDPTTGSARLGVFADGEGEAAFSVYRADGMFGGYLQGGQGSGKSRMIESICMSLAASQSHPTIVWYADGQTGSSSPLLVEHADWSAVDNEAFLAMLRAMVAVMAINGAENRLSRAVGFTPTADRPGLLGVIDECHKVFDLDQNPYAVECRAHALTITREGRKVGVALIMASQSPTLDAFGGAGNGAETLRAGLLEGNGVILRSKSKNAKNVFGIEVNPSTFPILPGYAYLCDPQEGGRSAPLRGYWVTNEMAAEWPARITWRSLPARQANYAGVEYARRREVAAGRDHADQELLARADAGLAATHTTATVMVAVGGEYPAVLDVSRFWLPSETAEKDLHEGQRKVLDAIRAGNTNPKDIIKVTGYSEGWVHKLLRQLERARLVERDGRGQYVAAALAA